MDMQLEQGVVPWPFRGSRALRRWNIGGAILCYNDMDLRLLNQKLIQRNSPAPKRIDLQCSLDFVGSKKRLDASGLVAVNHKMIEGHTHGEPANGHGAKFNFSASRVFQAGNQQALDQGVASAATEEDHHAQDCENGQNPGRVNDPGP